MVMAFYTYLIRFPSAEKLIFIRLRSSARDFIILLQFEALSLVISPSCNRVRVSLNSLNCPAKISLDYRFLDPPGWLKTQLQDYLHYECLWCVWKQQVETSWWDFHRQIPCSSALWQPWTTLDFCLSKDRLWGRCVQGNSKESKAQN